MVQERQLNIMRNGLGTRGPIEMDWNMLKEVEDKLSKDPGNFILWVSRGILYFNEDFEEAIASFSKALAINPFNGDQYYNRGRKFLSQDRFPQALADFTLSLRLDPNDNWKWHFCGVAYFYLDNFKEAIKCFRQAIDVAIEQGMEMIPPEVDWLWMSYIKLGDRENAAKCLDLVDENTPVERGDLMYKKRVLLYKGVTKLEDFEKSIEYDYDKRAITELYGAANYCYHILGDTRKAIYFLDRLLEYKTCHHAFGYKMALQDKSKWESELK